MVVLLRYCNCCCRLIDRNYRMEKYAFLIRIKEMVIKVAVITRFAVLDVIMIIQIL